MSTLRANQPVAAAKDNATIDQPPSFYEDDLRKKDEKYSKSIKDRQQFKR